MKRQSAEGERSILLAERDRNVRETVLELLEELGVRVDSAADLDEAIAALQARKFDVLLVDARLWFATQARLAQLALLLHPCAWVVLTGFLERGETLPPGGRLLPKPYGPTELRAALSSALRRSGSGRE